VFSGDEGTTQASRPSARRGVEFANYYSPNRWLVFDADASWSRSRFSAGDQAARGAIVQSGGEYVPEAVGTVVSAGATVDGFRRAFGSLRWRYFGPRPLIEDGSVRSKSTSLVNLQGGYRIRRGLRVALDVFNVLNTAASDVDYFYTSRLPGEPLNGIADIHTHPTLPRTARVNVIVGF
jgi:outer membrane receptor protein involved in Fe transport